MEGISEKNITQRKGIVRFAGVSEFGFSVFRIAGDEKISLSGNTRPDHGRQNE